MTLEDHQTIVIYRLERAEESLQAARLLRENGMLIPTMNPYLLCDVLCRPGRVST
jgi:hypothetical protein